MAKKKAVKKATKKTTKKHAIKRGAKRIQVKHVVAALEQLEFVVDNLLLVFNACDPETLIAAGTAPKTKVLFDRIGGGLLKDQCQLY